MGYEFKIRLDWTDQQRQAIAHIVQEYSPQMTADIHLEEDGIYICQYLSSDVWTGLEDLRPYLENSRLDYVIQEI